MNLLMASVLLLAMLAFQPTLIYGAKSLASARTGDGSISYSGSRLNKNNRNARSPKYGKRHSADALHSPALSSSSAKLVMSMESGDVLVRAARGAALDQTQNLAPTNGNNDGKRQKNMNEKLNKSSASPEGNAATSNTSVSSSSPSTATSSSRRKHSDKKFSTASGSSNQQHQLPKQLHSNANKANNKQRQMLKSQTHQNKRSGGKANKENVEKTQSESEKPSTTCRYAKSAWSECDPKTNMRSRTLTLKKGEPNCLETRTMQKKCKKPCRYEKGAWSECTNGQMTREDKLKTSGGGETSCETVRIINKKCNPNNGASKTAGGSSGGGNGKKERKNKEKGSRRAVKN